MTEFEYIVKDILDNKDFKLLGTFKHHKGSRLEHSIKVAKKSYEIARKKDWDYIACARAGLLHDFFGDYKETKGIKRIKLICFHGNVSRRNSEQFGLTDKERNIIESHMFPLGSKIPKSKEAVLVSIIDKTSASNEFFTNFRYKNAFYLILLFLFFDKSL